MIRTFIIYLVYSKVEFIQGFRGIANGDRFGDRPPPHNISINGKLKIDSIIYFVKSHLPGFILMPSIVIHCTQHNAAYRLSLIFEHF